MFEVKDKVVLVTGCSGGMGLEICKAFIGQGAIVYGIDIKDPKEKIEKLNFFRGDITRQNDIVYTLNNLFAEQSRIDVLVNCAGVTGRCWDETIAVNLTAPYYLTEWVSRRMIELKINGSIINIGSLNAIVALPNNPMYIASKGGLAAMTRSYAVDLAKFGIRVNCIHPGYFETSLNAKSLADPELYAKRSERTALGRWGKPHEIAPAVVFLASDSASYITGAEIRVDGGWTIKGLSE